MPGRSLGGVFRHSPFNPLTSRLRDRALGGVFRQVLELAAQIPAKCTLSGPAARALDGVFCHFAIDERALNGVFCHEIFEMAQKAGK